MNVQPALLDHPKFTAFKRELGAPEAVEYLLRLWGHCQIEQRGGNWGKVDAEYIEAICRWTGEAGKLFLALSRQYFRRPGWITMAGNGAVTVVGWDEENHGLISCWKNGGKGGRPRGKPNANRTETDRLTGRKPDAVSGKPIGGDRSEVDLRGGGIPLPPSLETVLGLCAKKKIAEEIGRGFFHHYEKVVIPPWTDKGGKAFQWQGRLETWAATEWEEKSGPSKTAGEKTRAQLEAELEGERDPARRSALKDLIKKTAA